MADSSTKPVAKGRHLNRVDLATFLGVSVITLDKYVRRGCPAVHRGSRGKEWTFDSAEVVAWLREFDVANAVGDTTKISKEEGQARKIAIDVALGELELAKARKQVVDIDEVAAIVTDELATVRSRLLSLPGRLAQAVAVEDDPAECERLIKDEVSDALEELSTYVAETDEDGDEVGT